MREHEGGCDDEDAEARGAVDVLVAHEKAEEVEGGPDGFAVDYCGGGGDDDANEAGEGEGDGDGEELGPQGVFGLASETSEVRVVDDQSGEVGDRGHDAFDDSPG